jgi:ketosteroid isomerase-like protein
MSGTNSELVRRFYEEVWNRGHVDVADEVFADDYVRHDSRPSRAGPGPAGQKQIATDFRRAFPDLRFDVEMIIAEGNSSLLAGRRREPIAELGAGSRPPASQPDFRA